MAIKKQQKRRYKLYMLVTNDQYELPMSLPMNVHEVSALTGLRVEQVYWACTPTAQRRYTNRAYHWAKKKYRVVSWYDDSFLDDDGDDYADLDGVGYAIYRTRVCGSHGKANSG